ncbi:CAAX prenyl protease 2-like [Oppia nitens]|uniref:CAAX prenyl protease 2-like n=1 Tax=Oppia nitens TaxID=1686743 RepID=UPI0023DCA857|nr:CAAX prenyl protease 2-like [Oppia nitens]
MCLITSLLVSSLIALLYVGSLYCWPNQAHRDNPTTIKRRFLSVFVAIIISTIVLVVFNDDYRLISLATSLGLVWPQDYTIGQIIIECIFLPLLQTSVLFMGPIIISLSQTGDYCFNYRYMVSAMDLMVIRNYIIAPITEEIIFRAVLSAILVQCWPLTATLAISSLLFGFAHSHHYLFEINDIRSSQRHHPKRTLWLAIEQMTYTSLFGFYASLLYFRSQHIVTPILVHSYCNLMGFPDIQSIMSSKWSLTVTAIGFGLWLVSLVIVYIHL